MKQITIFRILTLLLVSFICGNVQAVEKIVVDNELDFLQALGSDRTIVVEENVLINLSNILSDNDMTNLAGIAFEEQIAEMENDDGIKFVSGVFDGKELNLRNYRNLTIEGSGKSQSKIVTDPRYAFLFCFFDCENVVLRNLSIGHTEIGDCEGGVLYFSNCANITVENCDIYGCGVVGITANATKNLKFQSSVIRDCSHSILNLFSCFGFEFTDSQFFQNGRYGGFNIDASCGNISFLRCDIRDNRNVLFMIDAPTLFKECSIAHDDELGATVNVNVVDCKLSPVVKSTWNDYNVCTEDPEMLE